MSITYKYTNIGIDTVYYSDSDNITSITSIPLVDYLYPSIKFEVIKEGAHFITLTVAGASANDRTSQPTYSEMLEWNPPQSEGGFSRIESIKITNKNKSRALIIPFNPALTSVYPAGYVADAQLSARNTRCRVSILATLTDEEYITLDSLASEDRQDSDVEISVNLSKPFFNSYGEGTGEGITQVNGTLVKDRVGTVVNLKSLETNGQTLYIDPVVDPTSITITSKPAEYIPNWFRYQFNSGVLATVAGHMGFEPLHVVAAGYVTGIKLNELMTPNQGSNGTLATIFGVNTYPVGSMVTLRWFDAGVNEYHESVFRLTDGPVLVPPANVYRFGVQWVSGYSAVIPNGLLGVSITRSESATITSGAGIQINGSNVATVVSVNPSNKPNWLYYAVTDTGTAQDAGICRFDELAFPTNTGIVDLYLNKSIYTPPPNNVDSILRLIPWLNVKFIFRWRSPTDAIIEQVWTIITNQIEVGAAWKFKIKYVYGSQNIMPTLNGVLSIEIQYQNSNTFAALEDVALAPTPAVGETVHFSGAEWVQTPEHRIDPVTRDIFQETTGAYALVAAGNVGIQSTAGDIAVAAVNDASLSSATGVTRLTSLSNNIELVSQLDTMVTSATGDVTIQAPAGSTLISSAGQAILQSSAGIAGVSSLAGTNISSDDGNINLLASNAAAHIIDTIGAVTVLDKSSTQVKVFTGYESFVTADECLVNKKYLDNRIGASVSSYNYTINLSSTSPPVLSGDIIYNNAVQTSSTTVYLSHQDDPSRDIEVLLGSYKTETTLIIQDVAISGDYQKFTITAPPIVTIGNNVAFPVTLVSSGGVGVTGFPANHKVLVFFISGAGAGGSDPTKWTKGGDVGVVGGGLVLGTTNDSDVVIVRDNTPIISVTASDVTLTGPSNVVIGNSGSIGDVNISSVDTITMTTGNGGVLFNVPDIPAGFLDIIPSIVTPAMYSAKITGIPSAVPNVQYVLDAISLSGYGDVFNGGQPTGGLTLGTVAKQEVYIKAWNQNVVQFDTSGQINAQFPNYEVIVAAGSDQILTNKRYVTDLNNLKVSKSGDTMTGALDMGANSVSSSYVPAISTDLTNKLYVDDGIITLNNKSLVDSTTYFTDNLAPSKRMQFELSGVTAGATRILTIPNADGTIVLNTTAITQGGNNFGVAMSIGTNDNFDVNIRRNNISAYTFTSTGLTMNPQGAASAFFLRAPIGNGIGGSLSIVGGTAVTSAATGGSVSLLAGSGFSVGGLAAAAGNIILTSGSGIRANGGDITLTGGFSSDGSTNNLRGGNITLTTGTCAGGSPATGLKGGDLNFVASGGAGRVGAGNISITCTPMTAPTIANAGGVVTIQASEGTLGGANGSIRLYHKPNVGVTVEGNGTLSTNTPAYENLVLDDNDFPNRKYVTDLAATKVTKGGDTGAVLIIGTNDAQPVQLRTNATPNFTIETSGRLETNTAGYDVLVTTGGDNVIPNRKYVVDKINAQTLGAHFDTTFAPLAVGDRIRYSGSAWTNVQAAMAQMYWTNNALAENGGVNIGNGVTIQIGGVAPAAVTTSQFLKNFTHTGGSTNQLIYTGAATIIVQINYAITSYTANNDRAFTVECYKSGVVIPQSRSANISKDNAAQPDGCSKTFFETISTGNTFDVRVTNLGANTSFTAKEYLLSINFVDVA